MDNILSYIKILDDIKQFRRSGSKNGRDFNILDTPSHKYFKILFYFGSASEEYDSNESDQFGSGLLAPTWDIKELIENESARYFQFNSAWSYLKLNDENERAEKLEHFVKLLSDISANSPWYFSTVGGLTEALERKPVDDRNFDMNENKVLTITCLPDAFDNRIGTLLELYRDITWSWVHKREIIPSNLRKFDMAIYIFESPVSTWNLNSYIGINGDYGFNTSYKMLEFHDCEFKYNSIKSGYNELNNQTGFSPTYTIDISYSDCYEVSYNDVMMRKIGDVILTDLVNNSSNDNDYNSIEQKDSETQKNYLNELFKYNTTSNNETFENEESKPSITPEIIGEKIAGFVENAAGQLIDTAVDFAKEKINRALLGNLYGLSLTQIGQQLDDLAKGNLIKTGMSIDQYIKNVKNNSKNKPKPAEGNIYTGENISTPESAEGNIYDINSKTTFKSSSPLGNIYVNKSSIANN